MTIIRCRQQSRATRARTLARVAATALLAAATTAAAAPGYKWNPGHYMTTPTVGDWRRADVEALAAEPHVRGVQQRYWWAQLEPRRGEYDFSAIDAHLAVLRPMGKRLVIQVLDRSWSGSSAAGRLPAYLGSGSEFRGGWYVKPRKAGVVARLWEPAVMDRLIALYRALGARYDGEVLVEGIATEETTPAISPGPPAPSAYTVPALAAQWKRLVTAARAAWPTTNVFVYTNFLQSELRGIVDHCDQHAVGVGGPDVLPPPHRGADGDRIIRGLVGGVDYRGQLPIGYAVQSPSLCGKEGCFTPEELYDHAQYTLGVTHLFWVRLGTARDRPGYSVSWNRGVLPTIRGQRGRTNSACPTAYAGRCRG